MVEQTDVAEIDRAIHLIEIGLTIGKHILHIAWLFFGVTVALAAYGFATGNIVGGIIASIFAIADFVFIVQIYQTRSKHTKRRVQTKRREAKQEYKEAASA